MERLRLETQSQAPQFLGPPYELGVESVRRGRVRTELNSWLLVR